MKDQAQYDECSRLLDILGSEALALEGAISTTRMLSNSEIGATRECSVRLLDTLSIRLRANLLDMIDVMNMQYGAI